MFLHEAELPSRNQLVFGSSVKDAVADDILTLTYCEDNSDICKNGAKCVSLTHDDGSYRCLCREGTYGRHCEFSDLTIMSQSPMNLSSKPGTIDLKPEKPSRPENVTLVYPMESAAVVTGMKNQTVGELPTNATAKN
ncbi:hypothetical protein HUJ04_011659 [Dendroctonus ponderosae]|nr:hypothetical protein HUJ04_011659 [Dendroctonus ponderosae]